MYAPCIYNYRTCAYYPKPSEGGEHAWLPRKSKFHIFSMNTTLNRLIGLVVRVFTTGPGDLGSLPCHVIPKILKMVLDTSLLNSQHYKVCIKDKLEQSWERNCAFSTLRCSSYWKRAFGSPSIMVANLLLHENFHVVEWGPHIIDSGVRKHIIDSVGRIGNYAISLSKKIREKMDQFWRNCKPKKRICTCSRKFKNFGKTQLKKKIRHLNKYFDQSVVLKNYTVTFFVRNLRGKRTST